MKPVKFFFLMLALVICILIFDWVRNNYFPGSAVSPVARIRTIFIIVAGIAIMKFSTTSKGFKLFVISYLGLWATYYILNFAANHTIHRENIAEAVSYYMGLVQLETPLPFVFFWFIDRLFFAESPLLKKQQ